MAKRRTLKGTKISGEWATGKTCKLTGNAGLGPAGSTISIRDVKECATVCKSHYFDAGTMRFFKSRVKDRAYLDGRGGAFFTTSEKGPDNVRAYSVRHYDPKSCSFDTVGAFQGHRTSAQAERAAKRAATSGAGLGRSRRRR